MFLQDLKYAELRGVLSEIDRNRHDCRRNSKVRKIITLPFVVLLLEVLVGTEFAE